MNKWTVITQEDLDTGEIVLPFPEDMMIECGWEIGDNIKFTVDGDSVIITNESWIYRQNGDNGEI